MTATLKHQGLLAGISVTQASGPVMMRVQSLVGYRTTVAGSQRRAKSTGSKVKADAGDKNAGQVRIIAGRWRGRKLTVPVVDGLRPTGDRVRETLFNWLQGYVAGGHCLDLFAGSGALGFEALSRYACSVTFVETDAGAYAGLHKACKLLGVSVVDQPSTVSGSDHAVAHLNYGSAQHAIERWTKMSCTPTFNLVFIDPPFQVGCQWAILQKLVPVLLAEGALIYLESPITQQLPPELPAGCEMIHEKRFGEVTARLIRYSGIV